MPAAAKLVLALLPLLGVAIAVSFVYGSMLTGPEGPLFYTIWSCSPSVKLPLSAFTFLSHDQLSTVDGAFCALTDFFKAAVITRLNAGLLSLMASFVVPILIRLPYQSVSPNRKTNLFTALVLFLFSTIGQFIGFGMAGTSIGVFVYTLASKRAYQRSSSAIPPVPTAAYSIYLCNLATILTSLVTVGMTFTDTSTKLWFWAFVSFQLFPLFYLPVVIASFRTPKIKTEQEAKDELRLWDAEDVSYSFERTWSYYRTWGGISAICYWYGLNRIGRGVLFADNKWDNASHFLLFDMLGALVLLLALVLLERLTFRSKAERHPISGLPRPALDVECDEAIARAPAGSVWLEKTLTGFLISSLVAGPGFAACMWWCSGEEELGWKSRKAWREAAAGDRKKNK